MSDSTSSSLQSTLSYFGVLAIGAISGHLWARYRRRLASFQWSVSLQPIAFGTEDVGWGKVDILYEGGPTRNIHFATVQLQNASSVDFASVRVEIVCDQGTVRLRSRGQLGGSTQTLPPSPEFMAIVQPTPPRKLNEQELAYWNPRCEYVIPVFNRGGLATFTLMLSRLDHATPSVTLYCVHPGSKLKRRAPEQELNGVPTRTAQKTGLAVAIAIAVMMSVSPIPKWIAVAITLVAASLLVGVGVAVVRTGRKIASLAD